MRFLIDENLPRRLCTWLDGRGHEAEHVLACGLGGAADTSIWREAAARGACIVTRDADFLTLAAAGEGRVLHLTIGNCATPVLLRWLEQRWTRVEAELASDAAVVTI